MDVETLVDDGLTLEIQHDPDITVTWRGRSTARNPSIFLVPALTRLVERATAEKKKLVLDFRPLEYLNSSTVTPLIQILELARGGACSLVLRYDRTQKWQALSFTALAAFHTPGRVLIDGTPA